MTQRLKPASNVLNLDMYGERNSAKKDRNLSPSKHKSVGSKFKEKTVSKVPTMPITHTSQLTKVKPHIKQKNIPSPIPSEVENIIQYCGSEDSQLVEVTVKTNNTNINGRRSKDFFSSKEPWGQLLKQHRSKENVSLFGNFDPLRTLHFLAKELQIQLKVILPGETGILQMVQDMQYALKRVPPEVASTIHLQQAIDMLPSSHRKFHRSQSVGYDRPNSRIKSMSPITVDKFVQTPPSSEQEEVARLQKLMEKSTSKLEVTCQQFENLCTQLKKEKKCIEDQLTLERETTNRLRKQIEDLEQKNTDLINFTIKKLETQNKALEEEVAKQSSKTDEYKNYKSEIKVILEDLKRSKTSMEEEMMNLNHKLRLSAIEKEKYVAILAVRDRQINEIRGEMTQLQDVVNDQLLELQKNATRTIPSNIGVRADHQDTNKPATMGDGTISSINSVDGQHENKPGNSFQELQSGDSDVMSILQALPDNGFVDRMNRFFSKTPALMLNEENISDPKKSQVNENLKNLLSDLKKTV